MVEALAEERIDGTKGVANHNKLYNERTTEQMLKIESKLEGWESMFT